MITTYALCGFGSVVAIGINIGALGAVAPQRKGEIAQRALRAMVAGNIACFMTACVAGKQYASLTLPVLRLFSSKAQGHNDL